MSSLVTDAMSPWIRVEVRDTVASTNAELLADPRPWHALTTDHQVAGRGRLTRVWETPAGMAVALSACVPAPQARAADWGWLPLLTGLAVRDALGSLADEARRRGEQAPPADAFVLKWPNDVLVAVDDERKVCGVLCELAPAGPGRPGGTAGRGAAGRPGPLAVLGLGINVHQQRADLPVETATSLDLVGLATDREQVVAAVLRALARRHAQWATPSRMSGLVRDYAEACVTLGRQVAISLPDGQVQTGEAVRVDGAGRLVIRTVDGEVTHAAGDVVHATLAR